MLYLFVYLFVCCCDLSFHQTKNPGVSGIMVTTGISTMRMSATLLSEALGVEAMQATLGVDLHVDLVSDLVTPRSSRGLHFGGWWILGGKNKSPGSTVVCWEDPLA